MEKLLLSAHVVAGILFVGPVAVVTSLFPRYAPVDAPIRTVKAGSPGLSETTGDSDRQAGIAQVLHRITRVYGTLALLVPAIGLALAMVQDRTTEVWVLVAMGLTAAAGGLLALQIAPLQHEALTQPSDAENPDRPRDRLRRIGMMTGIFNLLWVIVVVLMVVRPGAG